MRRLLLAVLLLFATRLAADVSVEPADPTSKDPVTLIATQYDSCPPQPVLTRSGFDIHVELRYGICLSPPHLITWRLDLGTLAAGTYSVTVSDGSKLTFTVLDATPTVIAQPSLGSTAGGTHVLITAGAQGRPSITFDGVPVPTIVVDGGLRYAVVTPPHAAGPVLVTVTSASGTVSSYAFRYYDPAAPPLPELFAKMLIPVFYDGPGLLGSSWATEVALRNDNPWDVELYRGPDALPVLPASVPKIAGFVNASNGFFMILPREAESQLHANAVIRDVSRPLDIWGTEIPIVRESQFRMSVDLLNIPVDPHYRIQLRIYGLLPRATFVTVTATFMTEGGLVGTREMQLTTPDACSDPFVCANTHPAYATLVNFPNVPQPLPGERVAIRIVASDPIWAFATVTNNDTQHVTVISAQ